MKNIKLAKDTYDLAENELAKLPEKHDHEISEAEKVVALAFLKLREAEIAAELEGECATEAEISEVLAENAELVMLRDNLASMP